MIVFKEMKKIDFDNTIPPEKENQWTAFLNGEPDIQDNPLLDSKEKAEFKAAWETCGTGFSYTAANPDKAWGDLQKKISKPNNALIYKTFSSRVFQYAATILIVLGIGFAAYQIIQTSSKQSTIPVQLMVAKTEAHPLNLSIITLPDGSTVKMNADTRIEYPEKFAADLRKVKLSGEAFFEVKRDTARPFIIETANASVEVLGTSFNVSAYPHAELVEVNVKTGKVKLTRISTSISGSKSAILPAGQRGWINLAAGEIGHANALSPNYCSWITKEIIFQHTPLSEAFDVLENTYHVKISMKNPEIGAIPYTANFADSNLDNIIEVIARTHHLKVKRVGGEIIFARFVN